MDPISVAGLTIAVFDQLWKIGKKTQELVSDFRDYDSDSRDLENSIRDENNRTRALRLLLFEPSAPYGDKTLFEQFDEDVQNQIHIFLGELVSVIDEAYRLLDRGQYARSRSSLITSTSNMSLSQSEILSPLSTQESLRKRSSVSLKARLWWSIHNKRRVEEIVRKFSDLNSRILENIKLWCLGTSIGVGLQHLRRLEHDQNSKQLGFDVDAKLRLASAEKGETINTTLEMHDRTLQDKLDRINLKDAQFGVLGWRGKQVLVESHSYAPDSPVPVEMSARTRYLVERLAKLLHQPKELVFRTPSCIGWASNPLKNRISFIFEIGANVHSEPRSLLSLLSDPHIKPSLGEKFHLAYGLARCISQLQLVQWVHESFRSENILFFPREVADSPHGNSQAAFDFSQPWVLGFEFSRPETYFTHGHVDNCPSRDVYRHPHRQQSPSQPFRKIHDIYALGVVLLEIGLWKPALMLEKQQFKGVQDPFKIQNYLIRQAEKSLASKAGEKYKDIVIKCLKGTFEAPNETKEDLKLQQAFRSQVVDVLERAAECL